MIQVRHAFVSGVADSADPALVQPSDWNADHLVTLAGARMLARLSAGSGPVVEVPAGEGVALAAGAVAALEVTVRQEHCLGDPSLAPNGAGTGLGLGNVNTGSGAGVFVQTLADAVGVWRTTTGTSANLARYALASQVTVSPRVSGTRRRFIARARMSSTGDLAAALGGWAFGYAENVADTLYSWGRCRFIYSPRNPADGSIVSARLWADTSPGGSLLPAGAESTDLSGVANPADGAWHTYEIDIRADGSVTYRYDGTTVATHTAAAGVPACARYLGCFKESASTASAVVDWDWAAEVLTRGVGSLWRGAA